MLKLLLLSALPLYGAGAFRARFLYAGCLMQAAYLSYRGLTLGRLPLVGVHDTLIFLSCSLVAFSIAFYRFLKQTRDFQLILSGLAIIFTAGALMAAPHSGPLPPVLDTYWFELHVAVSFFSYALFAIGAALGILYLKEESAAEGSADPAQELERAQYMTILLGYLFFSLSMVFGGIWAYYAWGTYWLWTAKELWTSVLWLYYTFYLHARLQPRWRGRRSALCGTLGFLVVLFTYLGVGLLMKSSHSF
jgi:cytochrome c-type biogenesis protein CcsB